MLVGFRVALQRLSWPSADAGYKTGFSMRPAVTQPGKQMSVYGEKVR